MVSIAADVSSTAILTEYQSAQNIFYAKIVVFCMLLLDVPLCMVLD